jgi:hypothetical protein
MLPRLFLSTNRIPKPHPNPMKTSVIADYTMLLWSILADYSTLFRAVQSAKAELSNEIVTYMLETDG